MLRFAVALAFLIFISACDEVTAPRSGFVQLSVATLGGDPDDQYEIVSDTMRFPIVANAITTAQIPAGTRSFELKGVAENCVVEGSSIASIDILKDKTTQVVFKVNCAPTGLFIHVLTGGGDAPFAFQVLIPSQPTLFIPPNGFQNVSRLAVGRYELRLSVGVPNCAVRGDSITSANVVNRQMTEVVFSVDCVANPRTGEIAFVNGDRIFIMKSDGLIEGELARGNTPSWSRDGSKVVYSTVQCDYYSYICSGSIATTDISTRNTAPLNVQTLGYQPAWSPTDDLIAYTDVNFAALFIFDVVSRISVRLNFPDIGSTSHPSWSPDGKQIVFACYIASVGNRLCVANRDGSGLRSIEIDDNYSAGEPNWSPDGKEILFTKYRAQPIISLVNVDGSGLREITLGYNPSWSRDGSQIIFASGSGLFKVNKDGSSLTRLTTGNHFYPSWRR